jgi:hypothetical protein
LLLLLLLLLCAHQTRNCITPANRNVVDVAVTLLRSGWQPAERTRSVVTRGKGRECVSRCFQETWSDVNFRVWYDRVAGEPINADTVHCLRSNRVSVFPTRPVVPRTLPVL